MNDILNTFPKARILKTNEVVYIMNLGPSGLMIGSNNHLYLRKEYELKPFTGKIDRNGKKIFYGDFLTDEGAFGHECFDYGEIIWDEVNREYYISWKLEDKVEPIAHANKYVLCDSPNQ